MKITSSNGTLVVTDKEGLPAKFIDLWEYGCSAGIIEGVNFDRENESWLEKLYLHPIIECLAREVGIPPGEILVTRATSTPFFTRLTMLSVDEEGKLFLDDKPIAEDYGGEVWLWEATLDGKSVEQVLPHNISTRR